MSTSNSSEPAATGRFPVLVRQVRWEADGVVSVTVVDPAGKPLPAWAPGAHVELRLPSGLLRQYSLCGDPADLAAYTVAVLREDDGRGGSREVHTTALVGTTVEISPPRERFPLVDADHHLLIAGGIGVTPLLSMGRELHRRGASWNAVYCGRSPARMAFVDQLRELDPRRVDVVTTETEGRPALDTRIAALPDNAAVYCCGPAPMLSAVAAACDARGVRLQMERFAADPDLQHDAGENDHDRHGAFEVELRRSGHTIAVGPEETILEAVRERVADIDSSCEEGFCGTCECQVLEGVPDHRDTVLSKSEREANTTMMICVSRARSHRLVLDL